MTRTADSRISTFIKTFKTYTFYFKNKFQKMWYTKTGLLFIDLDHNTN